MCEEKIILTFLRSMSCLMKMCEGQLFQLHSMSDSIICIDQRFAEIQQSNRLRPAVRRNSTDGDISPSEDFFEPFGCLRGHTERQFN